MKKRRNRPALPLLEKFWAKVQRGQSDECWRYGTGSGYGQLGEGHRWGRKLRAHRISWEIHFGPIPEGMVVMHRCDNPPCVNPAHLRLGTQLENVRDMAAKGRHAYQKNPGRCPRGASHHNSKLTEEEVRAIRESRDLAKVLATRYGVSLSLVNVLRSKKARSRVWAHLSD